MAAAKSWCDEVTLLTLGLWVLSEARNGEGKQPLKQGCEGGGSAGDECILGVWTRSSPQISKH